ncbi:NUDIX domain-containing protein [Pontibacter sp. G13]|uniref:NUDIX domain-containing protein n=1 Tax=Pontibacter sp. G13 TaxID=3074898 RepID=UPI00288B4C45|nr:NUDIX domain-containing protein [Pontibacter sp. G13]WNJ16745.1 NUDIX domain-containing protein [Pontibacter sp. G13]
MNRFNVRIYGLLIHQGKVLVTDEIRLGTEMTKFPGGGLEFGEGTHDCLIREWQEELGIDITVGDLVYLNPFYQQSGFNPKDQVLAVYYRVFTDSPDQIPVVQNPMQFPTHQEGAQTFRWLHLEEISTENLTFPIDQSLVPTLKHLD